MAAYPLAAMLQAMVVQPTAYPIDSRYQIAAKYLGDPLMSWLVCDANGAMSPDDLTARPGRVLAITTPQGVPGGAVAQ